MNNVSKSVSMITIIAAIAVCLAFAGCSTQQSQDASPGTTAQGALVKDPSSDTTGAPTDTAPSDGTPDNEAPSKGVTIDAESKNAVEKTQETIASLMPDGVYTKDVTYKYHSGQETVTISLTLEQDVITAASVEGNNPNPKSAKYIQGVNDALPILVIGKKINELNLPRQISGSSLTAGAFRQYVNDLIES